MTWTEGVSLAFEDMVKGRGEADYVLRRNADQRHRKPNLHLASSEDFPFAITRPSSPNLSSMTEYSLWFLLSDFERGNFSATGI